MRFSEIIREGSKEQKSIDNNVVTALNLIQNRIIDQNLEPNIPVPVVLKYIQNTGLPGFSYNDLITANEDEPAIKNIIKNITPDGIVFVTDTATDRVVNTQDTATGATNPEQTVSNMAKSAMKRRQK